jgi:hypothetical protein
METKIKIHFSQAAGPGEKSEDYLKPRLGDEVFAALKQICINSRRERLIKFSGRENFPSFFFSPRSLRTANHHSDRTAVNYAKGI